MKKDKYQIWFKNGTYIERIDEIPEDTTEQELENLDSINNQLLDAAGSIFEGDFVNGKFRIGTFVFDFKEMIAFAIDRIDDSDEIK